MMYLEVFFGAVIGGIGRLFLSRHLPPVWGTFTANMIACGILGWATNVQVVPTLLGAGVAGALSTWSTLAKEVGCLPARRGLPYLAATILTGAAIIWLASTLI